MKATWIAIDLLQGGEYGSVPKGNMVCMQGKASYSVIPFFCIFFPTSFARSKCLTQGNYRLQSCMRLRVLVAWAARTSKQISRHCILYHSRLPGWYS